MIAVYIDCSGETFGTSGGTEMHEQCGHEASVGVVAKVNWCSE